MIQEYVNSITFDVWYYKELDGVYFEIWKRVTKQKVSTSPLFCTTEQLCCLLVFMNAVYAYKCMLVSSNNVQKNFRDALDEVYKLNRFPLRQQRMKYLLENDRSIMEKEVGCFSSFADASRIYNLIFPSLFMLYNANIFHPFL